MPETAKEAMLVLKSFGAAMEVKDAEKGLVEAIIATLGVVDKDEDIIRPDAIPGGAKVSMSSYGHDAVYGDAPVGKGTLHVDGNKLVFKGRVFLATVRGRESFETLKEMDVDQQWSFGFRILGAEVPSDEERKMGARRVLTKLDPFEVSPVIIGAGVGTRTVGVKAAEEEVPPPPPPTPDPAIEAARLAEVERQERQAALTKQVAINDAADRMFKRAAVR